MIEQRNVNIAITEGLKRVTGCEIVKANLANAPIPPYPYISFTILNWSTKKGTYSKQENETYIQGKQTWSFTVQGIQDDEAFQTAQLARDWFEESGRLYLNDNRIVIQSVGEITNRDTLLTLDYEYRKGFDVVLSLMNVIKDNTETMEQAELKKE